MNQLLILGPLASGGNGGAYCTRVMSARDRDCTACCPVSPPRAATREFVVIGDGGARRRLERAVAEWEVDNVELRPPVPRAELLTHYADADVPFLHLNDLPALRRVLPSKLFEYAATGKPILAGVAGVAGVAADFLRRELPDAGVFDSCDLGAAVTALESLPARGGERDTFIRRYRRSGIMDRLTDEVLEVAAQPVCR